MVISGFGPFKRGNIGIITSDYPSILTRLQRKPISMKGAGYMEVFARSRSAVTSP